MLEYQNPKEPGDIVVGNIYVDVDGTLINEITLSMGGEITTEDEIDDQVVAGIKWIHNTYPGHRIIVWSGGGEDYARVWRDRCGLDFAEYMAKEPGLVNRNDIVVDDMAESFLAEADTILSPSQFVVYVNHERQR